MALAFVAGAALGCVYFAGLWLTVRQIPSAHYPRAVLIASFIVRILVLLGGFYLVIEASWERAVACLLGFLVARTGMVGYARYQIKTDERRNNSKESN